MENDRSIIDYIKSTAPLEDREQFLFDLIGKLDVDSYKLFSDVIDCNGRDFYKIQNLSLRIQELSSIAVQIIEGYEYLAAIEASSYNYAVNRFRLKSLISTLVSIVACSTNVFLGIGSFILLNKKASNDYIKELKFIGDKVDRFDDEKMKLIANTIANCARLYDGKVSITRDVFRDNTGETNEDGEVQFDIDFLANLCIINFQNGDMSDSEYENIPDFIKESMIEILNKDLNMNSLDLMELLNKLKEKNEKSLQFTKRYKKIRKS